MTTVPPALRLLHLSDLHFGTEQPAVVDALVDFAHALQPQALILSGDLTQRATAEQFDACAAFLARLPRVPRLVIPGNHDLPLYHVVERMLSPFARYRRFVEAAAASAPVAALAPAAQPADGDDAWLDPVLSLPGLTVLGVNTSRRWRQQNGALSARQIDRVEAALRASPPGDWRLVVTHHPLGVRRVEDLGDRPIGHAEARRRWAAAGVHAMLSGHIHVPVVLPLDALPAAAADGGAAVQARLAQADAACSVVAGPVIVGVGTGVSSRLVAGFANSVNVLVQEPAGAPGEAPARRVERHDHDPRSGRFERVSTVALAG